jgi:hypothetical protein
MLRRLSFLALTGLLATACGGDADAPPAESEPEPEAEMAAAEEAPPAADARVMIVSPAEGDTVEGPNLTVELDAMGVEIVPAGDTTSGTGHHHLFLNEDVSDPDVPIPSVEGTVIHMGDGSSSYTFEDVPPGDHRVIAVVADGVHVPLRPWVVDTVTFTVR